MLRTILMGFISMKVRNTVGMESLSPGGSVTGNMRTKRRLLDLEKGSF
jgi:hypothetical protein